jgi:hypothetical protein
MVSLMHHARHPPVHSGGEGGALSFAVSGAGGGVAVAVCIVEDGAEWVFASVWE